MFAKDAKNVERERVSQVKSIKLRPLKVHNKDFYHFDHS